MTAKVEGVHPVCSGQHLGNHGPVAAVLSERMQQHHSGEAGLSFDGVGQLDAADFDLHDGPITGEVTRRLDVPLADRLAGAASAHSGGDEGGQVGGSDWGAAGRALVAADEVSLARRSEKRPGDPKHRGALGRGERSRQVLE